MGDRHRVLTYTTFTELGGRQVSLDEVQAELARLPLDTVLGLLRFRWRAALPPPRIVEHMVAHELAHLHEPHHTPEFWRRVERVTPDFEGRKAWLARARRRVRGVRRLDG